MMMVVMTMMLSFERQPVLSQCAQVTTEGGTVIFYVSHSPYPSSAYYELKIESSPGLPGFIYVAKPPTQDERGVIFCNIDGDERNRTNSTIDCSPGPESQWQSRGPRISTLPHSPGIRRGICA